MKKQIRQSVFETNSSSTHAICISKDGYPEVLPKSVTFLHGEYGWEFEVYKDIFNKAAYLNEAMRYTYDEGDELEEAKEKLRNTLLNHGINVEFEPDEYGKYGYESGYIDHGYGTTDFVSAVMNDEDKLMTYLFGDSMVVTGNDNEDSFSDYMYDILEGWNYQLKEKFNKYEIYEKGN